MSMIFSMKRKGYRCIGIGLVWILTFGDILYRLVEIVVSSRNSYC